MKLATPLALILAVAVSLANSQSALPRLLGYVPVNNAAFVEAYQDIQVNGSSAYTIYVSTFNPINFSKDPKYYLRNPGPLLNNVSDWNFLKIDDANTAFWPNNPDYMPAEVAGAQGIVWTSGFLVPGKKKGSLELYDTVSDPPNGPFPITQQDETEWSYHRVVWKDMDADGDLDALVARFHVNLVGTVRTQFAWLENPGLSLTETPSAGWNQHVLQDSRNGEKGPDVHFRNFELVQGNDRFDCIIASEFWREELALYYTTTGWNNWTEVTRIAVDPNIGQSFDLYVDDVNRDGKVDIMAASYDGKLGSVFVYEIPEDIRNGTFVKHTIADGFKANGFIGGQSMSPGSPKTFYPSKAAEEELVGGQQRKPLVIVSGDDDGAHYILEPVSEDRGNWTYTKNVLIDTEKDTVGKYSVVDLDGDGYNEIIAAGYSIGRVYVFTYKPE